MIAIEGRIALMQQEVQIDVTATIGDLFGVGEAIATLRRAEAGEASVDEIGETD